MIDLGLTTSQKNTIKNKNNTASRVYTMFSLLLSNSTSAITLIVNNYINKLDNIKLTQVDNNTLKFTNSEGVDTVIDLEVPIVERISRLNFINPNPSFYLDDFDYTNYIAGAGRSFTKHTGRFSKGSLEITGKQSVMISDSFIPIKFMKAYRGAISLKANHPTLSNGHRLLVNLGVLCYDGDNKLIRNIHTDNDEDKQFTITNTVNVGDTTITVTGDKWEWDTDDNNRNLLFHKLRSNGSYCYVDANDLYYEELEYSRDVIIDAYAANGLTTIDNNTFRITLNNPSTYSLPAGTKIRNTITDGDYRFMIINKKIDIDNDWHYHTSSWRSEDWGDDLFFAGTKYVKIVCTINDKVYDSNDDIIADSNLNDLTTNIATLGVEWDHE